MAHFSWPWHAIGVTATGWRRLRTRAGKVLAFLAVSSPSMGQTPEALAPTAQRLYADTHSVWIYQQPKRSQVPLGYFRAGQSVPVREPDAVTFDQCPGGWYAIAPAGFVCAEAGVSLSPTRYHQAMQTLRPTMGPNPFFYGVSVGTLAYRRIPAPSELPSSEVRSSSEQPPSPTSNLVPTRPVPWFLEGGGSVTRPDEPRLIRREVPEGTLLSIVNRFERDGRDFYQLADGTLAPVDRLEQVHPSPFAGRVVSDALELPLAWARRATPIHQLSEDCQRKLAPAMPVAPRGRLSSLLNVHPRCLVATEQHLASRDGVALSGRRISVRGQPWVETREKLWLPESSLHLALTVSPKHALASPGEKWLHFSIQRGTLVAYEGTEPVFATLASPGDGKPNGHGGLRLSPIGTYRINFKHLTDDMSTEDTGHGGDWKADVPFAMYFNHPYAIHAAYWHDSFGAPRSGGCVNVSPRDGAWLFGWTDPALPQDWYGVSSSKDLGLGTVVHISQ